jgi:hypothetical protein
MWERVATGQPAAGMATMFLCLSSVAIGYAQNTATLRPVGGDVRQVARRLPSAVLAGYGPPKAGKPVATRSWGSPRVTNSRQREESSFLKKPYEALEASAFP